LSKVKGAILQVDEHPMREIADKIWGINIVRNAADLAAAPESVQEAFKMYQTVPPYVLRCGSCGEPMKKVKGMAVMRLRDTTDLIPVSLCGRCIKEPVAKNISKRVFCTMTGFDRKSVDWKETLN